MFQGLEAGSCLETRTLRSASAAWGLVDRSWFSFSLYTGLSRKTWAEISGQKTEVGPVFRPLFYVADGRDPLSLISIGNYFSKRVKSTREALGPYWYLTQLPMSHWYRPSEREDKDWGHHDRHSSQSDCATVMGHLALESLAGLLYCRQPGEGKSGHNCCAFSFCHCLVTKLNIHALTHRLRIWILLTLLIRVPTGT